MTDNTQSRHVNAARRVGPVWDAARARRVRAGVARKHRRFVVARTAAVAVAVAGLLAAGAVYWGATTEPAVELAAGPAVVEFGDGSRALPVSASDLVVEGSSPREISVRLRSGRSRFEVSESQSRQFVVRAAGVTVTVSGTVFTVQHLAEGVRVDVHEGTAQIESAGGRMELTAGNHAVFAAGADSAQRQSPELGHGPGDAKSADKLAGSTPADPVLDPHPEAAPVAVAPDAGGPNAVPSDAAVAVAESKAQVPRRPDAADAGEAGNTVALRSRPVESRRQGGKRAPQASPVTPKSVGPDWRALAKAGDVKGAAAALVPAGRLTRVDDLMRAADVMRHAGRHADAMPYLERVERRFASSPQASLASFQRARILLRTGGSCRAAALFAKAGSTTARPSLREDALAREVQAWSRCGKTDRAKLRAHKYVARYPNGHFLRTVRKHGGL
jgi:hypothetical protein